MTEKQYGDLKIVWHPEKLQALREGVVTAPIHVRLKPTNACNHNCDYCIYHDVDQIHEEMSMRDLIPPAKMAEIISDFREMGVKATTFSGGGEPLVYPHIVRTLEQTLEAGIDLAMNTNGQRLKGSAAELLAMGKWVRVSCDSVGAETYAETRRISINAFGEVVDNIRQFTKIDGRTAALNINFVVTEKNQARVYNAVGFFKDLGVNNIKFTPVWSPQFFDYHAPFVNEVRDQIARARSEFEGEGFSVADTYEDDFSATASCERQYGKCQVMQVNPVIGADETVYFCHNKAYSADGKLGSIKDCSFRDLWFGPEAAEIFKTFDPREGCKHQCTGDPKNIATAAMIACAGKDENFA